MTEIMTEQWRRYKSFGRAQEKKKWFQVLGFSVHNVQDVGFDFGENLKKPKKAKTATGPCFD